MTPPMSVESQASGGTVRLPDGTLAGSAASLLDCLRVLVDTVGCSVDQAMGTATSDPQELLGVGPRDDRVIVTPDLELVATVIRGRVVYGRA
jgi:N-acetylglucosamine-6-phosphate deacetylase